MHRAIAFVLTCCIGGRVAADCNEVLLYDNGYPNGCNGIRSEVGGNAAADDYHGPAGDFDGLHWYTLDAPGNVWDGNVTISVYDDADGDCLPDETAAATIDVPVDGGVANRTLILSPGPFSFDRWRYDAVCLGLSIDTGMFISAQAAVDSFWETTRCGVEGDTIVGCDGAYDDGNGWVDLMTAFGDTSDLSFLVTSCLERDDPCACDFNGDVEVDIDDLLIVLANWGGPGGDCTGDGVTDVNDLLAVLSEWGDCSLAATNDDCDDAILIFEGTTAFSTEDATVDPDDPPWSCESGGGPDVWFCFQAETGGSVLLSTCDDADFDTVIAVYETDGPGCDGELIEIACNDDGLACSDSTSEMEFDVDEGDYYKIRIGGAAGAQGSGNITIFMFQGCLHTCNLTCDSAFAIGIDDCKDGSTVGAPVPVLVQGECAGFIPTHGAHWFTIIGDGTTLTASTCVADNEFDTILIVMCGGCNYQFCVAGNDDDPSCFVNFVGESTVSWCTEPGVEYIILVTGNEEGEYELCVTSDGVPCKADPLQCVFVCADSSGVANDCCEDRLPIGDGTTAGIDTTGANTDGQPHASCQFDGQTYHDVWFNYTASCDGLMTVSTCGIASYDTDIVVYDGCGECYDGFTLLGCNDDGAGCSGFSSQVIVPVTGGNCYKIRLGGWNDGDQGVTDLDITCDPTCTFECPAGADQEEGPQECPIDGDDANLDPNGGCNSDPVSFGAIDYGVPLCGQASTYVDISGGQFRDTDWYMFSVPPGGHEVTLTCHAEFGAFFGIVLDVDTCAAPAFVVSGSTIGNCDERSVTAFLAEGNYAAFCATNVFDGAQCSTGLNDYWLRIEEGAGPCMFECPAGASAENGPQQCPVDGDDASIDPNGGCNNAVPSFGAIAAGETVCGQGSTYVEITGGNFRDTDWYLFNHGGGDATMTVNAEFTALFGIVSDVDTCAAPAFVVFDNTAGNCDEQSVTAVGLAAGNYAVFVAPSVFVGVPCSDGLNDYWVRLD